MPLKTNQEEIAWWGLQRELRPQYQIQTEWWGLWRDIRAHLAEVENCSYAFWGWGRFHCKSLRPGSPSATQEVGKGLGIIMQDGDHSLYRITRCWPLGKSVQWGCTDNVTVGWKRAAKDMMATLVCHWEERDSPTPYSCHYTRPSLVDVLVAKSKCSPPGRH